jgi:hypothetical protein
MLAAWGEGLEWALGYSRREPPTVLFFLYRARLATSPKRGTRGLPSEFG